MRRAGGSRPAVEDDDGAGAVAGGRPTVDLAGEGEGCGGGAVGSSPPSWSDSRTLGSSRRCRRPASTALYDSSRLSRSRSRRADTFARATRLSRRISALSAFSGLPVTVTGSGMLARMAVQMTRSVSGWSVATTWRKGKSVSAIWPTPRCAGSTAGFWLGGGARSERDEAVAASYGPAGNGAGAESS